MPLAGEISESEFAAQEGRAVETVRLWITSEGFPETARFTWQPVEWDRLRAYWEPRVGVDDRDDH